MASLLCVACVDTGDPGQFVSLRHRNDGGDRDAGVPSPVQVENRRPGTSAWTIQRAATSHEIEGYASVTSAAPGDVVSLYVNVTAPSLARADVYRTGWYGGLGGRLVQTGTPFVVPPQPACPAEATTGMVECKWQPSTTLEVGADWVSGQYLVKLVRGDGFESYVPLVVRETGRRAPLVVVSNVFTAQAYNAWGGASLYMNELPAELGFTAAKAYRVSFDRPYQYARPLKEGQPEVENGAGQFFLAERWMNAWLERRGYDVAYVSNVDLDADRTLLDGRKLFLDAGHDEYWTQAERDAVDAARDAGVSLAFFSANDAYWHVRLEPSSDGVPRRVVTCYKSSGRDPSGETRDRTTRFRDPPVGQPEDALVGQMYDYYTNLDGFPLIVGDAGHWLYAGTGLRAGDTLPHLVGYEWDHIHLDSTTPSGLEVVASSPVFDHAGVSDFSNVTVYYPTQGSLVFSGGTISWALGLGKPGYSDVRVERMTENVLDNAGVFAEERTRVPETPPPADVGDAWDVTVLAGAGVPGYADGVGEAARFDTPVGVTYGSDGVLYVTESRNHRVRAVTRDGVVTTLAGCGPDGSARGKFQGGHGTDACFDTPSGIAMGPDGRLYLSETMSHRIRVLRTNGDTATYAGDGNTDIGDAVDPKRAGIAFPRGLTFGPDGALYVVSNFGLVRKITSRGVTTVASSSVELSGVAVTEDGTVYASSPMGAGILVAKEGLFVPVVNGSADFGDQSGPASLAKLRPGEGLAYSHGTLFVADAANEKIRRVTLASPPSVRTLVGSGMSGTTLGSGADTRLSLPRGLAVIPDGLVVADSGNHRLLLVRARETRVQQ
ncbi:MAG TPA: N,N-dimethylformamidase beta subunit family domain-containing protein [Polyangiaceae bacterium]|nr:N,N-dimethylformamidase beta subunit family domain-containing protein [Polyangiaceae bacterium]